MLILLFSMLIILMSTNIIQRNLLGQSSQEILEYLPTLVLWISLLGASLALRQHKHISMELVIRWVSKRYKLPIFRAVGLFGFIVMAIGLYLSVDFMAGELKILGTKGFLSSIIPGFFMVAMYRYLVFVFHPEQFIGNALT